MRGHLGNEDVLFQAFYWDVTPPEGKRWWAHLESKLPELAEMGIGALWVPPPCKGAGGADDMGYSPYDLYDLGSKDQKGTVATRFGTKAEFLRLIGAAHRHGIKVYVDMILNHAGGADYAEPNPVMENLGWDDIPNESHIGAGQRSPNAGPGETLRSWTGFAPKGADGKSGTGRFPRDWRHFHPNEAEPDRDPPFHQRDFGEDYAFQGDDDYVRRQFIAWSHWFIAQTGADGYRMDDLKGIEPDVTADFIEQGPPDLWVVGEYFDGGTGQVQAYLGQARNSFRPFDFPLYFALKEMTFAPERFKMRRLREQRLPDRERAVMFAGSHDVSRNENALLYNVPLAYAVILAMAGTPTVYYSDLWRAGIAQRKAIIKLIQVHSTLARGEEIERWTDKTILAIERRGHLLAVFHSGGDDQERTVVLETDFGPNVKLKDYVGDGEPITTDKRGCAAVTVAPFAYHYYAPAGRSLKPRPRKPLPTSQTWEFADDLDTGRLGAKAQTIPITLADGETLRAELTLDRDAVGEITVLNPAGKTVQTDAHHVTLANTDAGTYELRVRTTNGRKAHGALRVRYGKDIDQEASVS